jgi:hypothetical protein
VGGSNRGREKSCRSLGAAAVVAPWRRCTSSKSIIDRLRIKDRECTRRPSLDLAPVQKRLRIFSAQFHDFRPIWAQIGTVRQRTLPIMGADRVTVDRMGGTMNSSTIFLAMCFAVVPLVAHATAQHHHALHQAQLHAMPGSASAFVAAVKLDDNSDGLPRNDED